MNQGTTSVRAVVRVGQVGLDPAVTDMNIGGLKSAGAEIAELVRDPGRAEDDLTGLALEAIFSDGEQRAPFADDEEFVIGVNVPPRSGPDLLGGIEEHGEAGPEALALDPALPEVGLRGLVSAVEDPRPAVRRHHGAPLVSRNRTLACPDLAVQIRAEQCGSASRDRRRRARSVRSSRCRWAEPRPLGRWPRPKPIAQSWLGRPSAMCFGRDRVATAPQA